jgi:hypothetical protein
MPSGARIEAKVFRTRLSRKRRERVLEREKDKYEGEGSYRPITERPSNDENCAGLVMRRLFGIGKGNIDPHDLLKQVLRPFGRKVARGAAGAGDVVVYRSGATAKHVAIVESGGVRVRITSKDQLERAYRATLPRVFRTTDPLIQAHGEYEIWRLDPGAVQVVEVTEGDCP